MEAIAYGHAVVELSVVEHGNTLRRGKSWSDIIL